MLYTRRDFGKIALATIPAASIARLMAAAQPNSVFGGVRIGAITYSFRALPGSAEETLKYCLDCGFSGIELMSPVAENYAGSPSQGGRGSGSGSPGGPPAGAAGAAQAPETRAAAARRRRPSSRKPSGSGPRT